MFAEVDIILDMAKFKAAVPESVLYYLPPGTMILFDHITVSTSSFICCATERPVSLAIWNDAQQCLEDMPPEVYNDNGVCVSVYIRICCVHVCVHY